MEEITKRLLTPEDIAYMLEPSVLKLDTTKEDVDKMIAVVKKYGCKVCFCWPCYYEYVTEQLAGSGSYLGTSLAFPSGQESTALKVWQAKDWAPLKPIVNDMVMNVGLLKSGKYDECLADIKAVREAAPDADLKVIIEAMLLTDDEIRKACDLTIEAGADYVKTGTGFSVGKPTTLHHVKVMKDHVGDRIKIKVAGGVRSLDTLLKMYKLGACRFGIGLAAAEQILADAAAYGRPIDIDKDVVIDPSEL